MDIPSSSLAGRTALVTGAGRGIGKAIALGLATHGADVGVIDIDSESAEQTAREVIGLGRRALAEGADCRERTSFESFVPRVLADLGGISILVNNVGGNVGRADFLETDEDDWRAAIDQNLMPTLYGIRAVAPEMIERSLPGSIINVSTIEAFRAAPGYAVYAAAKAGVVELTKTLALELGGRGIRVNGIAPDITPSPRFHMGSPEALEKGGRSFPLGRFGQPEDYAGTALYLASDLSIWITGETLHVGGGTMAAAGWLRDARGRWVQNLPIS